MSVPAGHFLRRLRASLDDQPRRAGFWSAAIVAAVLASLVTHGHFAASGDALHYMVMARSVAFDGDLDLSNNYDEPGSLLQVEPEGHVREGQGGVARPVHDIGLPVIAAPYFWVAYRVAESSAHAPRALMRIAGANPWITLRQIMCLGMIAVTTALAWLFFETAVDLRLGGGAAFAGTLAWALSPPVLTHGYVFFTEIPSALVAFAVFRAVVQTRDWTMSRAVLAGWMTGLLWLLHTRNIGLVIGLTIVIVWRLRGWSGPMLAFGAGLALLVAARAGINHHFWGTWLTTPLARVGPWTGVWPTAREVLLRASGLLFDPNNGLLPSSPIYLLAPWGWVLLRRRDRAVARDVAIIVACYLIPVLLPVTNVQGWRGGWSPAARFLTPIAPFVALGVPMALSASWSRSVAVRVICIVQFALSALLWAFPMAMWSDASAGPPFVEKFAGQRLADALPRWDGWTWHIAALTAGIVAGWIALVWLLDRNDEPGPSAVPAAVDR